MRTDRTTSEKRILDRLDSQLKKYEISNPVVDPWITDRPDILIDHENGRLGIEVTRLDYEEYCKWLNTPPEPPYSRAGEVTINLKKLLASVMKKKRKKYQEYKILRSLSECWLILHNDVFEFKETVLKKGVPDKAWFEEYSCYELQELSCPFDRVLFNLEHPNIWYSLYDKQLYRQRKKVCYRWPSIIYKECALKGPLEARVYPIDFSDSISKQKFE
jgi:hypothetical protein